MISLGEVLNCPISRTNLNNAWNHDGSQGGHAIYTIDFLFKCVEPNWRSYFLDQLNISGEWKYSFVEIFKSGSILSLFIENGETVLGLVYNENYEFPAVVFHIDNSLANQTLVNVISGLNVRSFTINIIQDNVKYPINFSFLLTRVRQEICVAKIDNLCTHSWRNYITIINLNL